jgi:hypothetical protein
MVKNEGDVQIGGFGPYPISYRSIIPRAAECRNLLVPVCLSATHIAYGSIRMEPVFMVLSQSAAVAAVMALKTGSAVQEVDVKQLQQTLVTNPLADNSTPEILVDNDDKAHIVLNGSWTRETKGGYGPSLFADDGKSGDLKSVQFTPSIVRGGNYKVYAYFPKLANSSSQTAFTIFDGTSRKERIVKEADVRVEGQTSGEWVQLGSYILPAGKKSYVEISNRNANGAVAADAVLFIPGH